MNKRARSELLLLLASAIWGFAFVAQRAGMDYVGPFTYTAARFALGSGVLAIVLLFRKKRETPAAAGHFSSKKSAVWSVVAGVALFLGASTQQVGMQFTTAGKGGFITGLYVVIVPVLGLFIKRRPPLAVWIGAVMAAVGLYFLCVTEQFTVAKGDGIVLLCALLFAGHVLVIGHISGNIDSIVLACVQFAVCSIISWAFAFALETVRLADMIDAAAPIIYGGMISAGIGYTLQVVGQKHVPPANASIIMSLEAVFAAVGGYFASFFLAGFADEILSLRGLAGCVLMLLGMFLASLSERRKGDGA